MGANSVGANLPWGETGMNLIIPLACVDIRWQITNEVCCFMLAIILSYLTKMSVERKYFTIL